MALARISRIECLLFLSLTSAVVPLACFAQTYPNRPITLVVPFTTGTGNDTLARIIGPRLIQRWGQPVVVDNKPGASGTIGADIVAKAAPNGYTLMLHSMVFTVTPALFRSLAYDPVADFTHIAKLATGSMALVVNPAVLPAKTLDEVVSFVKSKPGRVNYASPGNGTPQHLAVELLKQRLGLDLVHVPYKGAAGATTDLLGGQVQLMVMPVHAALPHARAGKLNVIAVSGESRSVLASGSPSFAELGLKNLDIDLYFWISGPAGLPREIVQKWNQEAASILALPEVRESLLAQGLVPAPGTAEELSAQIRRDIERWKGFIAETRISAD